MKQTFKPTSQKVILSLLIFLIVIGVIWGCSWLSRSISLKLTGGKTHSLMGDANVPDFGNDFVNLSFLIISYFVGAFVFLPIPFLLPLTFSYVVSCLIITRLKGRNT